MKPIHFFALLLQLTGGNILAQQQNFAVVSYTAPKGWQQQQNDASVQLSVTDKKTGAYAIALITKASPSDANANENFNTDWNRLVKAAVQISDAPTMQEPVTENGWDVISGTANYTDGNQKGLATLLTATGGTQMVSVVLMTNTDKYQNELLAFINSLQLTKPSSVPVQNQGVANGPGNKSIVGLWTNNILETSGYINGMPQYTAGYFRREYAFHADGSYLFRTKMWSTTVKDILFVYESGTYAINGNQITITPKKGKGEWWSKKDNRTTLWGNLVKASSFKLEKTTYHFEIKYFSGSKNYALILFPAKGTERDGTLNSEGYSYSLDEDGISIIDNPPGFKIAVENKGAPTTTTSSSSSNTINSTLAGKIWEGKSLEKYGAAYGNMSGFYSGGFWTYQYKFNADGTYHFVYNAASAFATNPVNVLQYETGTYAVNGKQITITPLKGANEEWSVGKVNNGMSAETIRKVLETRIKRLKTSARKLEKVTYPFNIEFWEGNNANALCLKHTQNTVREGSPGQNDQSCYFETTAAKAENFSGLFK